VRDADRLKAYVKGLAGFALVEELAGVRVTSYEQAWKVVAEAAVELGVPAARLDHSIWTYMSKAGKTW
jgi:hypothetical protein